MEGGFVAGQTSSFGHCELRKTCFAAFTIQNQKLWQERSRVVSSFKAWKQLQFGLRAMTLFIRRRALSPCARDQALWGVCCAADRGAEEVDVGCQAILRTLELTKGLVSGCVRGAYRQPLSCQRELVNRHQCSHRWSGVPQSGILETAD